MHLPDLQVLLTTVRRLDSLLTDEYEALKSQKIEAFEALQAAEMEGPMGTRAAALHGHDVVRLGPCAP